MYSCATIYIMYCTEYCTYVHNYYSYSSSSPCRKNHFPDTPRANNRRSLMWCENTKMILTTTSASWAYTWLVIKYIFSLFFVSSILNTYKFSININSIRSHIYCNLASHPGKVIIAWKERKLDEIGETRVDSLRQKTSDLPDWTPISITVKLLMVIATGNICELPWWWGNHKKLENIIQWCIFD